MSSVTKLQNEKAVLWQHVQHLKEQIDNLEIELKDTKDQLDQETMRADDNGRERDYLAGKIELLENQIEKMNVASSM